MATEQLKSKALQMALVIKYFPICSTSELQQLEDIITSANKDICMRRLFILKIFNNDFIAKILLTSSTITSQKCYFLRFGI